MANQLFAGFAYNNLGDAINGITVNLYDRNTTAPVRATTTTDANGYWSISHATEGRFDVEVVSGTTKRRRKYDDSIQLETIETAVFRIRNPADTFDYDIVPAAITADRQLNLPLITATDTLATLGLAQTFTAVQTFNENIVIDSALVRWTVGLAVVAADYEITRDLDVTNQLHLNVPTGATFELSVNDVAEYVFSATTFNINGNTITNTGVLTLPTATDTLVGRDTTDTLTNKTLTSPVVNTQLTGTAVGTGASQVAQGNHTTPAATATVAGHVPTPPNNTTTFLRGDMTFAAPAGGAVVRQGGNTIEVTHTSTVSADRLSATGLSFAADLPLYVVVSITKSTGAAAGVQAGFKLNTTQVQGDFLVGGATNAVEEVCLQTWATGRVTNHTRGYSFSGEAGRTRWTADGPTVVHTAVVVTGLTDNALVTQRLDELQVFTLTAA